MRVYMDWEYNLGPLRCSERKNFRDVHLNGLLIDISLLGILDARNLNFSFVIFNPVLLLRIILWLDNGSETSLEVVFLPL
jgi:hypothetical protein